MAEHNILDVKLFRKKSLHIQLRNRAASRNSKGVYVERPWETDPYNTFSDYVEGRVGKVKDKLAGNSSSISTSSSVITSDGKMPEMLPKKSEAKAKKK